MAARIAVESFGKWKHLRMDKIRFWKYWNACGGVVCCVFWFLYLILSSIAILCLCSSSLAFGVIVILVELADFSDSDVYCTFDFGAAVAAAERLDDFWLDCRFVHIPVPADVPLPLTWKCHDERENVINWINWRVRGTYILSCFWLRSYPMWTL